MSISRGRGSDSRHTCVRLNPSYSTAACVTTFWREVIGNDRAVPSKRHNSRTEVMSLFTFTVPGQRLNAGLRRENCTVNTYVEGEGRRMDGGQTFFGKTGGGKSMLSG